MKVEEFLVNNQVLPMNNRVLVCGCLTSRTPCRIIHEKCVNEHDCFELAYFVVTEFSLLKKYASACQ